MLLLIRNIIKACLNACRVQEFIFQLQIWDLTAQANAKDCSREAASGNLQGRSNWNFESPTKFSEFDPESEKNTKCWNMDILIFGA